MDVFQTELVLMGPGLVKWYFSNIFSGIFVLVA